MDCLLVHSAMWKAESLALAGSRFVFGELVACVYRHIKLRQAVEVFEEENTKLKLAKNGSLA